MSVINKVLRDLDSRAADPDALQAGPGAKAAVTLGTASVAASGAPRARPALRGLVSPGRLLAVLGLAVVVGLLWFGAGRVVVWRAERDAALALRPDRGPAPVPESPPAPAAAAITVAASAVPAAEAPAPRASAPVPDQPVSSMAPLPRPPASAPELPSVRPPVPATQQQALVVADAMVRAPASAPVAVAPAPGPVPATAITRPRADTPAPEPASAPVPWPDAALEAVAQAQRLWNAGTREPALELLRDALAGIERNHAADLSMGGPGAAAALAMVRELVRMEMVQAHHASVLAVLKRHERVWANQADLWAVRGSAAQRLSQHAESAQAYLVALRLRPGEPRWMLGAAVSLAAQGQPGPAADLVEQARAISVVSPDVLAYLRQLGVPMRER